MLGTSGFEELERLIEPTIRDLGFALLQARMIGGARRTLQVMVEPAVEGRGMTVEDCAEVSQAVSAVLDVADPIEGSYALEVSSPGIDRPLVRPRDFERFKGSEARIELAELVEGRRRFRGRLEGLVGGEGEAVEDVLANVEAAEASERLQVAIAVDGVRRLLPLSLVRKARLVLSEDLVAKGSQAGGG